MRSPKQPAKTQTATHRLTKTKNPSSVEGGARSSALSASRQNLPAPLLAPLLLSVSCLQPVRRVKKRHFRALWIQRIGAAARNAGMSYSTLMHGLKAAGIEIDRKMLADIAVKDAPGFLSLAEQAKAWARRGDVFAYFISGAKVRNPAAAQALIKKLG